ncbi:MAG: hypothetical protein DME26_15005 [Verrucomicrobia bacterium]|nr:MAG: hypothetical protein DME26_15005 [Verrucomicrobiota bacterium]
MEKAGRSGRSFWGALPSAIGLSLRATKAQVAPTDGRRFSLSPRERAGVRGKRLPSIRAMLVGFTSGQILRLFGFSTSYVFAPLFSPHPDPLPKGEGTAFAYLFELRKRQVAPNDGRHCGALDFGSDVQPKAP